MPNGYSEFLKVFLLVNDHFAGLHTLVPLTSQWRYIPFAL